MPPILGAKRKQSTMNQFIYKDYHITDGWIIKSKINESKNGHSKSNSKKGFDDLSFDLKSKVHSGSERCHRWRFVCLGKSGEVQ